jgi:hypothetical protein
MFKNLRLIQKVALGFAGLFLGVYLMDFVPGVMDENGKMFGLFGMTPLVDAGHLALGAAAVICALISKKAARFYFWMLGVVYWIDVVTYVFTHLQTISPLKNFLVNLPHTVIFISAFIIAAAEQFFTAMLRGGPESCRRHRWRRTTGCRRQCRRGLYPNSLSANRDHHVLWAACALADN